MDTVNGIEALLAELQAFDLDAALAEFGPLQFNANMADLEVMLASVGPLNFAWPCPNCKTWQSDCKA